MSYPRLVAGACAFFLISLYVKFRELVLTEEYRDAVRAAARWARLTDAWYAMVFARDEALVFLVLLAATAALWRLHATPGIGLTRVTAFVVWGVLPLLSVIEVLGLSYYAAYQAPFPATDLAFAGASREIIATAGVWSSPRVLEGLALVLVAYPLGFHLAHRLPAVSLKRVLAGIVGVAAVIVACGVTASRPALAGALLGPHPAVWFLVGRRPAFERLPPDDVLAPTGTVRRAYDVKTHPRNLILLMLESTPAKAVYPYNTQARAGRRLFEEFAGDVTVFDRVYSSAPFSVRSLYSIVYGERPRGTNAAASPGAETLSQAVRRRGFHTETWLTGDGGVIAEYGDLARRGANRFLDSRNWPRREQYAQLLWGRDDRLLFDELGRWLGRRTPEDPPLLLFAITSNTHVPYEIHKIPGKAPAAGPQEAHAALVEYDLDLLTEFYARLRASSVGDQTAVLIVADHGEAFNEHPDNIIHSKNLYAENVHVPCLLVAPARLGLPAHIRQLGSLEDIRATVFDLLGLQEPVGRGLSLLFDAPDRIVFSATDYGPGQLALRDSRYSYLLWPSTGRELLFDRESDPGEMVDVAAAHPDVSAAFRSRLSPSSTMGQ